MSSVPEIWAGYFHIFAFAAIFIILGNDISILTSSGVLVNTIIVIIIIIGSNNVLQLEKESRLLVTLLTHMQLTSHNVLDKNWIRTKNIFLTLSKNSYV